MSLSAVERSLHVCSHCDVRQKIKEHRLLQVGRPKMTKFVKFTCVEPSVVTIVTKLPHLENERD